MISCSKPIIALDPGKNGGVATYVPGSGITVAGLDADYFSTWQVIHKFGTLHPEGEGFLEKVPSYVGKNIPSHTSFQLGQVYGQCQMALLGARVPFVEMRPQDWQRIINAPKRPKKCTSAQWKSILAAYARELYPDVSFYSYQADALLILHAAFQYLKEHP